MKVTLLLVVGISGFIAMFPFMLFAGVVNAFYDSYEMATELTDGITETLGGGK